MPDPEIAEEDGDQPEISGPSSNVGTAVIRTITPYLTALVIAKAADWGIGLDDAEVNGAIVVVGGSVWYALVTWLERQNPAFGWLLGSPSAPKYDK